MDEVKKDDKDLVFNVMPEKGKEFAANLESVPAPKSTEPGPANSRKLTYILIGIVVLLVLGAAAYYMLGTKKTVIAPDNTVATKLPKSWLAQYFSVEKCTDQTTCGDEADKDDDGLSNYAEFKATTNPLNPDTDQDGLADGDEVNIFKTEPTIKYTDKRPLVEENEWTDGYQIKGGFDPLTPGLKFTEIRNQQIKADTETYKLHEPTITTLGTTTDVTANWKTYSNAKYGFEFQIPNTNTIEKESSGDDRIQNYTTSTTKIGDGLESGQYFIEISKRLNDVKYSSHITSTKTTKIGTYSMYSGDRADADISPLSGYDSFVPIGKDMLVIASSIGDENAKLEVIKILSTFKFTK